MYNDYLMHHGVKGMRWGHRKQRYTMGYGVRRKMRSNVQQPRTPEEAKRARRRKIAKRVAIGVGAAAAIGATAYAVHRTRQNTNNDIREFYRKANLELARGTADKDMQTFGANAGKYNRGQLKKIMKADKYGNAKDFHKAVSSNVNRKRLDEKINSAAFKAKHAVSDGSAKASKALSEGASKAKSATSKAAKSIGEGASKAKSASKNLVPAVAKGATSAAKGTANAAKKAGSGVVSGARTAANNAAQRRVAAIAKRTPLDSARDTTGVTDYTMELLRKNKERLRKAGR